jgi:hypothetical protein
VHQVVGHVDAVKRRPQRGVVQQVAGDHLGAAGHTTAKLVGAAGHAAKRQLATLQRSQQTASDIAGGSGQQHAPATGGGHAQTTE